MSLWDSNPAYDSPAVKELINRAKGGAIESTVELRSSIDDELTATLSERDRLNLMMARVIISQGAVSEAELLSRASEVVDFLRSDGLDVSTSHRLEALSMASAVAAITGDTGMCFDMCTELAVHLADGEGTAISERANINFAVTLLWLGAYELCARYLVPPLEAALDRQDPAQAMVPALNLLVANSRRLLVSRQRDGSAVDLDGEQRTQLELVESAFRFVNGNGATNESRDFARVCLAHTWICRGDPDTAAEVWGDLDSLTIHPADNFTSYLAIVEAHLALHLGNYDRALTLLDRSLVKYSTYDSLPLREVESLQLRAETHERMGNPALALADTRKALQLALQVPGELPELLIDELARRGEVEQSRERLLVRTTELTEQTLVDKLTSLGNRRALDLHLDSLREGEPVDVAMLVLDIDEFKRINDTHGHQVGDRAIMAAAELLVASCRRTDRLVRYGGEEFVVIPASASLAHGVALAERIRSAFAEHDWSTAGVEGSVTCSVGVAGGSSTDVNRIFEVADKRMFAAKRAGRNAVVSAQDHLDV